jgi:hypothetical protein
MSARRRGIGWVVLAAVLAGGCLKEPTEIVVVVDSDLELGVDFDKVEYFVFASNPNGFPSNPNGSQVAEGYVLPSTLGFVPQEFGPQVFDVMAVATRGFDPTRGADAPVVRRRVSNIAFVPDQRRALFITLLRQCMCNGTNCDVAPPCNDITTPTLTEFDEDHIPHL